MADGAASDSGKTHRDDKKGRGDSAVEKGSSREGKGSQEPRGSSSRSGHSYQQERGERRTSDRDRDRDRRDSYKKYERSEKRSDQEGGRDKGGYRDDWGGGSRRLRKSGDRYGDSYYDSPRKSYGRDDRDTKSYKDTGPSRSKSDSLGDSTKDEKTPTKAVEKGARGDTREPKGKRWRDERRGGRDRTKGQGIVDEPDGGGASKEAAKGSAVKPKEPSKDAGSGSSTRKDSQSEEDGGKDQVHGGQEILSLITKNAKPEKKTRGKEREIKDKGGKSASDLEAQWQKEEEERRKKEEEEERQRKEEEEKIRLEEEKKRQEEERKRQEEEEAERLIQEEIRSIEDFAAEMKEKIEMKVAMREANRLAAENRPDESFFTKLDSSLKKNTAFVKKLKNLTETQKDSLTKDFNGLNLTKYVGETAVSITEAKLKMSDINCALHMCSLLHQRYADFSASLLENWNKVLPSKKDEKIANASKLRVDLRLFGELVSSGVFSQKEGLPVLANQLQLLIAGDKEEHNNVAILLSFCKHCGDDYAGLLPRRYRLLAEKYEKDIPRSQMLKVERQKACRNLLREYYTSLCKHLTGDHKELKSMEKQNRKILQTKGELSTERKEKYESSHQTYTKLLTNTSTFSDLMDEPMPELKDEVLKPDDDMGLDVFSGMSGIEYTYEGDATLFEDDDTRQFYETLPDLKALVPGILYKDSVQAPAAENKDTSLEEDAEELNVEDVELELEVEQKEQLEKEQQEKSEGEADGSKISDEKREEELMEEVLEEGEEDDIASSLKLILDAFLQSLPTCVNRELIDKAAIDFCMNLNTKTNRKKLVKALFSVQRTRYDLLPFYSRLVATLNPCMPDLATDLDALLKGDFKWHVRKKDQINIESKLKTVRFIGELVKFNIFSKSEALHCLKMLMFDFSHHNIEMACALLEVCGRFLYRSPDSHHRTKVYLDVMMRKKSALHLDSRYTTLIENAYYYSNPPDIKQEARKVRPPMQEYIRRQLYKELSKTTTEKVLRQMRKLNWDDPEVQFYVTKCMIAVWNVRYNSVHCLANLLAGLAPYYEQLAIQVVDGVLEDFRLGMEINHPKYNQRRVSCIKYLGELYNYRMVESAVIFKVLYSCISFAVTLNDNFLSPLDPPEHLFRIRLVCVLLDTCGQYFDRGSSKKRLDCFLVYFQRYYWYKKKSPMWSADRPFPMDVEYMMRDTVEALRPKLKLAENWEEAYQSAEEMDKEFRARLVSVLPQLKETLGVFEEGGEDGLPAIQETDETDDPNQNLSLSQYRLTDEKSSQDSEVDRDTEEHTDSQSQSQSQYHHQDDAGEEDMDVDEDNENGDDDDDDDEDESDVMESAGEDEDEDCVTMLTGGPKVVQCAEDDEFQTAFEKMMADNITQRTNENVKVPQLDIAVPMHIRSQKQKQVTSVPYEEQPPEPARHDDGTIKFVLMHRKGNKQQFANLDVPITAEFAAKYREREEVEKMEKERMKRMTLDIHERQEEEDYQEMMLQTRQMISSLNRPATVNTNRERRQRYQHPKGAPDADLIFGSK